MEGNKRCGNIWMLFNVVLNELEYL